MATGLRNPSQGVPPQLLPHVHLVNTYPYPTFQLLSLDTTVDNLLKAPKITREVSPMVWTFLNAPPDGTIMLVWQPPSNVPAIAARFATDGYVWADAERSFSQPYKGYNVEMFVHKVGFCPPHEPMAVHSRRRYRLTPLNPNDTSCDPSLWLVHYSRADLQDHIPSQSISIHPALRNMLQQRNVLQAHGGLLRKEFMLGDTEKWPTIGMPAGMPPQHVPQQGMMSHPRGPPQGYMPVTDPSGPSPAKRQRQTGPMHRPMSSKASGGSMRDSIVDDEEEDRDLFDFLTSRDISMMRFSKHHEWMEEIYASPYATMQIEPVSLGLGRKGELASLTDGFVEAPSYASITDNVEEFAQKLDPAKSTDFEKRAADKIASIGAEMKEMERLHAKRMGEITQGSSIRDAEKALRNATTSDASHADPWRLESGFRNLSTANSNASTSEFSKQNNADDIGRTVEAALNKRIEVLNGFTCRERGGLEEKAPPPPEPEREPHDTEMADDGDQNGLGSNPLFDDFTTDIPDLPETELTGEELSGPAALSSHVLPNLTSQGQNTAPLALPNGQIGTNDWVIVDKQSAALPSATAPSAPANPNLGAPSAFTAAAPVVAGNPLPAPAAELGSDLVDFGDATPPEDETFTTGEFDDQIDFGGLDTDTAGEAMEDFGDSGGAGADADTGMGLEDSAFGDAFHHTEAES